MRRFFSLFLLSWSVLSALAQTTPTARYATVADMVAARIPAVPAGASGSISALVTGRVTANDGAGGVFFFTPASVTATNAGTVFPSTGVAGRWFREYSGPLKAEWFGQSSGAKNINSAIASLGVSGGIVDARGLLGAQVVDELISIGNATSRVQVFLGLSSWTVNVPTGFELARSCSLIGAGSEGSTVIQGDDVNSRILIRILQTFGGESNITIRDLELRLTGISDTGIDAACLNRSLIENVYIRKTGLPVSTGTGISIVSINGSTRNYRNQFINVILENIANGLVMTASGANGPNSCVFTKFSVLSCTIPVTIGANVFNTTFLGCNIETTGGITGIVNAGTETTLIAPFIESFTTGVLNTGTRLRVYSPSWGANTTNLNDTGGTDTFAEDSGGGGPGSQTTWDSGSRNWGFGLRSPNAKVHVYRGTSNSNGDFQVGGGTGSGLRLEHEGVGSGRGSLLDLNNAGGSNNRIHIGFGNAGGGVPSTITALFNQAQQTTLYGPLVSLPSGVQTLTAPSAISAASGTGLVAGSGGAVTLTSVPTIADGVDGQLLILAGTSAANTLTIQDESSLAGSNLELGAATRTLGLYSSITLQWFANDSKWREVSFSSN